MLFNIRGTLKTLKFCNVTTEATLSFSSVERKFSQCTDINLSSGLERKEKSLGFLTIMNFILCAL